MSMKNTIAKGDTFVLYEEALDNTSVHLEFEEVELDLAIRETEDQLSKYQYQSMSGARLLVVGNSLTGLLTVDVITVQST